MNYFLKIENVLQQLLLVSLLAGGVVSSAQASADSLGPEVVSDTNGFKTRVTHSVGVFNGVSLHYVQNSEHHENGKTVVFLHGYPELWYAWKNQMVFMGYGGHNFLAPDLRGFNHSEKPNEKGSYSVKNVSRDIVDFIEKLVPNQKVILVGHDWGGSVAWQVAYDRPDLIDHLMVMNIPHPGQIRDIYRRPWAYPKEFLASSYVLFLGLPELPDLIFRDLLGFSTAFDLFVMGNVVNKHNILPSDKAVITDSWAVPGALEAATDYYRDNLHYYREIPDQPLALPVDLVFGMEDAFMSPKFADSFGDFQPYALVTKVGNAGHYVHHDAPFEVNRVLGRILRRFE